jgi:hypothetical protein
MTNADPNTAPNAPHGPTADPAASEPDASFRTAERSAFDESSFDDTDAFSDAQFAIELGKEWVRQHQTAAMLGAFALGAFVGALLRD